MTDSAALPTLSVVVPLYNEEESILQLARELEEALDELQVTWEVIFVDDGSSDRTFETLGGHSHRDKRFRAIRLSQNCGQTAALQAGFSQARGEIVATMDGDLQNDPRDIHRLVEKLDDGFDVVSGWRRDRKDRLVTRKIPSWCANWLLSKVTGVRLHDNGCALKAYRKRVLEGVDLYSDMHRFIPILLVNRGAKLIELEVNHRPRRFGTSKYGLSRTWKVLLDISTLVMITRFFNRPGQWFGLLSLPILVAGLLAFGASVYQYLNPSDISTTSEGLPIVLPGATVLLTFAFLHSILMAIVSELIVFLGDEPESGLLPGRGYIRVEEI
jgi:glycosyltransferase involved in cell wall biosynthesis